MAPPVALRVALRVELLVVSPHIGHAAALIPCHIALHLVLHVQCVCVCIRVCVCVCMNGSEWMGAWWVKEWVHCVSCFRAFSKT